MLGGGGLLTICNYRRSEETHCEARRKRKKKQILIEKKMKKNFRAIALGLMGLALFSCEDNNNPITNGVDTPTTGTAKTFTLSATMGEVAIEPLANNTNPKVDEDDLRATLHFHDDDAWATTSYAWNEFGVGAGKTNARWGGLLGANLQPDAKNCTKAVQDEMTAGSDVDQNTIWFNIGNNTTISGQKLMMYCKSGNVFGGNLAKSLMCIGGRPGGDSGAELTRQYFKIGEDSNPNKLIAGLKAGENQENRSIPVMTHVRPYADFKATADGGQAAATFAPRGSLIGLIINNKLGRQITVTDIIVRKDNALNFSGYFDWNVTESGLHHANFEPQYPNGNTAIIIPVKQDGTNNVIAANNDVNKKHNDNPSIFYLWGIQDLAKKGQPLRVQIRYKSNYKGNPEAILTTRTFRVYPGKTKAEGEKRLFEDGRAYKTILNLDAIQQKGGTFAGSTDWKDGEDYVKNVELNAINPLQFVAKYDIAKVANTQGLDHELKFVTNHNIKANEAGDNVETDYTKFEVGKDVGYYTWAEAMRLFGYNVSDDTAPTYNPAAENYDDKWGAGPGWENLKNKDFTERKYRNIAGQDYYLPEEADMRAIIPSYISLENSNLLKSKKLEDKSYLPLLTWDNQWDKFLTTESKKIRKIGKGQVAKYPDYSSFVRIGDISLRANTFYDEYITKDINGSYVTYAIRFRGTKFESAWRYERKKAQMIGTIQTYSILIKNVMLWKNSDKTLEEGINSVATEEFFELNNTIERTFPIRGIITARFSYTDPANTSLNHVGGEDTYRFSWLRDLGDKDSSPIFRNGNPESLYVGSTRRVHGLLLRPFARNHY